MNALATLQGLRLRIRPTVGQGVSTRVGGSVGFCYDLSYRFAFNR